MTSRLLCWIGRPSRRTVLKAIPVLTGDLDTMSQAIPPFASVSTGPPVARVPSAVHAPPPKRLHANSRSGCKPTMKRFRPRGSARRRRSSKPKMRCGRGLRAASPKGYGTLISVRVAASGWRAHLQQLLHATAMNIVRVIAWRRGAPLGERRRKLGHLARLAPYPLSRQAVFVRARLTQQSLSWPCLQRRDSAAPGLMSDVVGP
jgi:hypothetical protein